MSHKAMSRSRVGYGHRVKGIGIDESSTDRLQRTQVRPPLWPKDSLYIGAGALMVAASDQSGFILFKEAIFELPVVYKSEFECLMRGTGSKTPVRLSVSLREG
jgi:hypothetical protein